MILSSRRLLDATLVWLISVAAWACPADSAPRDPGTRLQVQVAGATTLALGAADLDALPQSTLTQRQSVVASAASASSERNIRYAGIVLRDLLLRAGVGGPDDRGARIAAVEAVATDGYRAIFSWGELFNTAVGDQVLVATSTDGRPLDAFAGALALRSLADSRPGPRHVRNLCALIVRR